MKRKKYKAAIYLRLSRNDDDLFVVEKSESNSITNQRMLAMNYIDKHDDIKFVKEYQDDGYTGMNFDRPGLKQMLDDIDQGIIDCIIVKDLSRFGRERIEAGTYLLKTFNEKGVRFIAINDCYDSLTASGSETHIILPIKALTNDNYSRDISLKVRSSKEIKMKKGDFIGPFAPYGYDRSPDNKSKLVIDEEAASVVKSIFARKLDGKSALAIARELTQEGVLTPSEYRKLKKGKYSGFKRTNKGKWSARQVIRILENEIYIGTLVQGKTEKISYKVNKVIEKPKDEWVRVENVTEPIISKIDFRTVQTLMKRDLMQMPEMESSYLYNGLLYCGDCKSPMIRCVYKGKKGEKIFYQCSSKKKYGGCSNHRIEQSELDEILRKQLTKMLREYSDCDLVKKKLDSAHINFDEAVSHDKQIGTLSQELIRYNSILKNLDIDREEGIVGEEQYYEYKDSYEKNKEDLEKAIAYQKELISRIYNEGIAAGEKLNDLRNGLKIGVIEKSVLVTFVDMIEVYEDNSINIMFRYQPEINKLKELDEYSDYIITALRQKEA